MTISTQLSRVDVLGNGSATTFSFSPVTIFEASDLVVTMRDASGNQTALAQGASNINYSLNVSAYPGTGSITYPAAGSTGGTVLPTGSSLTIRRILPILQATALENQGAYLAAVVENEFDLLCAVDQQLQEQVNRALQVAATDPPIPLTLPTASIRKNMLLGFDSLGNPAAFTGLTNGATVSATMIPFVEASSLATARALLGVAACVTPQQFGAAGGGVTVDTAIVQAAANSLTSGGYLLIPAGVYLFDKAVTLHTGTTVIGHGVTTLIKSTNTMANTGPWDANGFFVNAGGSYNGVPTQIASDITIRDIGFDGTLAPFGGALHAIRMGQTTRVRVEDCYFSNVGDSTAFIGCVDTIVKGCFSYAVGNCGYDHWGGSVNCVVEGNTVKGSGQYGSLFTAADTADTTAFIGTIYRATNNTFIDCAGAAVWVNALGAAHLGDSTFQAVVNTNTINSSLGSVAAGIKISGAGQYHQICNNSMFGLNTGPTIVVSQEGGTTAPGDVLIANNTISNCTVSSGNVANINVTGDRPLIVGNHITGGTAPNLIAVSGTSPMVLQNYGIGATSGANVSTAGAVNPLVYDINQATNTSFTNIPFGTSRIDTNVILATSGLIVENAAGQAQLTVPTVASAANYLALTPAVAGAGPIVAAVGTSTNINLNLAPKGSGVINLGGTPVGTATAGSNGSPPATVAGYLPIMVNGGLVKLPYYNT